MANIVRTGGGNKSRLLTLGTITFNPPQYGNGTVSATFNVKNVYSDWNKLTVEDFAKQVNLVQSGRHDGGNGTLQTFTYSYSNGVLTVSAKQTSAYTYVTKAILNVVILDRGGG